MQSHILKNTLLHTAFSVILPAGNIYIPQFWVQSFVLSNTRKHFCSADKLTLLYQQPTAWRTTAACLTSPVLFPCQVTAQWQLLPAERKEKNQGKRKKANTEARAKILQWEYWNLFKNKQRPLNNFKFFWIIQKERLALLCKF